MTDDIPDCDAENEKKEISNSYIIYKGQMGVVPYNLYDLIKCSHIKSGIPFKKKKI